MGPSVDGKVALITGGASGIGAAVARRLASAGAKIVIADRDATGAGRVAAETGGAYIAADLSDPEASRHAVALAEETYGRLDLVHLNAGTAGGLPDVADLDLERYRAVVGVNVDAVVFGVHAALPALRRSAAAGPDGAAIAVTASLAGLVGFAADPIYTMTKHAVVGLVRALAEPLAAQNIRVSAICPGFVDTPLIAEQREVFTSAGFPLLTAEDVAAAVEHALLGGESGALWVVQPGRDPVPYVYAGVPGPRGEGAGRRPPL